MTTYNVHIYREMRLVFGGIAADSHEAAASIAHDKPTDDADDIADCEGENLSALVDVQGDEEYKHSRVIDFEHERERRAAPKLLAALTWLLDDLTDAEEDRNPETGEEYDSVAFGRAAIADAKAAGIQSEPSTSALIAALKAVLPYAEAERASLENCCRRDDDATVKEELEICDRVLAQVAAAIAQAAGNKPEPCKASPKLLATLESVAALRRKWRSQEDAETIDSLEYMDGLDSLDLDAVIAAAKAAGTQPELSASTEMYDTLRYVAEMLSGLKPDFLRNIGLDVALEKTEAALLASETRKA